TARATGVGCPPQSLTSATADCSQIDGGNAVTLHDDGLPPDVTAGDGTFSGTATVGPAATAGAKTITFTGNFSGGGTATTTANHTVPGADDAGDLPATATPAPSATSITGVLADANCGGQDSDMYIIHMCDPANFSASTLGNGNTLDTQLFLFT